MIKLLYIWTEAKDKNKIYSKGQFEHSSINGKFIIVIPLLTNKKINN